MENAEKGESQKETPNKPQKDLLFKRNNIKRHNSLRTALCDSKETQLKNLAKLDLKNKRKSVMLDTPVNFGFFNFEKEEADEDDDVDSDSEEDNEKKGKSPAEALKEKKEKETQETSNAAQSQTEPKEKDKKKEEKIDEKEEEEDDMPEYFDPINEKGGLRIPLKTKNKYKKSDFDVLALSGKGAYGTVLKVKLKSDPTEKKYAIKVMDIFALDRIKKLYQAYLECDILSQLDSPYIVDILGAFDENKKIYIVMEYLSKGDFSDFIRLNFPLKPDSIQFYAAEIVNFLDYMQSKKIVHRDLKPENIMMNDDWHLKVIDFATARVLGKYFDKQQMKFKIDSYYDISETDDLKGNKVAINEEDDDLDDMHRPERRGMTFVGTAEYVSPEVLGDKPAGFGADIWSLGIMIYQMYNGKTPFKEKTNYLIFRKIEQLKIDFHPNSGISEEAKDLINKILVKDPSKRLGAGEPGSEYDIAHLKKHPYFKGIDWDNLHKLSPPNSENFDYLMSKKKNNNTNNKKNNMNQQQNKGDLPQTKKEEGNDSNKNNDNEDNEGEVLRRGYLDKKSRWFHYNKRKVLLYSKPKLVLIDPAINKVKSEIYLDKRIKIIHISDSIFELITPLRSFRFRAEDGDALVWEKSINEAIKSKFK